MIQALEGRHSDVKLQGRGCGVVLMWGMVFVRLLMNTKDCTVDGSNRRVK